MNFTAETRDIPTPQPELFSLLEEEPGSGRPGSVTDPVPQEEVERHIVEHRIEACPYVQILDAPVPQGGNQLVEAFRHLDFHNPQQVIEVPKTSSSPSRSRRRRVPLVQTAEQLVEVPEFVSFAFLARACGAEHVDIPVLHGRGGGGGLQGLRPGQVSAASSSHSPGAADVVFI